MTARRKARPKAKAAGKKPGDARAGAKSKARRKARPSEGSKTARRQARPKRAGGRKARTGRGGIASLADRVTELVEHAAAGALRRVVDTGGREVAAWLPEASEVRREAGSYLRELREVAGLTIDELAEAIELRDRSLLEAVEAGTATLSFELVLRLAAVLARHDPVPFIARLLRSYNPLLWQLLEDWGVGRLPLQLERERAFVNVLRSHDTARDLSDADFERVLDFTRAAFELGLHFAARDLPRKGSRGPRSAEGSGGRAHAKSSTP